MQNLSDLMKRFAEEEEGLELVEYALLGVLVVVALAASYAALPDPVVNAVDNAATVFP